MPANECAQFALNNILDLGSANADALTECMALVDRAVDLGTALEETIIPQSVKDAVSNIKPFVEIMDTLSEVCDAGFHSAHLLISLEGSSIPETGMECRGRCLQGIMNLLYRMTVALIQI